MGTAVVAASAVFVLVRGWAVSIERQSPGPDVPVVLAAADIPRGAVVGTRDVRVGSMPSAWAPPGHLDSAEDAQGLRALSAIAAGEPLTEQRLTEAAGPTAAMVPDGLRASVVPTSLPEGAVVAGDRVDVMATFGGGQPYTDTVGEGLEVLSVVSGADADPGPSLVVLVDPAGAERIAHARAFAELDVAILGAGA